jgi:trk system potassium uptake protein TrkA
MMRVVIAGAGEVGYNLALALAERHEVYVIERDVSRYEEVMKLDVEAIHGNAANMRILQSAEIEKADLFLAVTGNDEANLLSGIAAKKLGAKKVIVRVENPEYVDKPIVKNHPIGLDVIICPQLALAQEAARLIGMPGAIEIVTFSGGRVEMIEIQISADSLAAGKRIKELNLPPNVVVTSIYRNGTVIIPRGDTLLKKGDRVAVVGKIEDVESIRDLFGPPVIKRVAIFGAGTVGSYIARILEKSRVGVKIIDSKQDRCELLCSMLDRAKIICGDATDIDLLVEEEIGRSDVVVATTESDERNLLLCLLSKSLGAKMSIAKVEKREYIRLFETVGVDVALNPRKVTYHEVMKLLGKISPETLAEIEDTAVIEVAVKNPKLAGKTLKELKLPRDSVVGAVVRGEECLIPRGDTVVNLNDRLLIFTTWDEIEEIEKIFS